MRPWPAILAATACLAVVIPVARHFASAEDSPLRSARSAGSKSAHGPSQDPALLKGIQFERLGIGRTEVTAPAPEGRIARLTVDPNLQRATMRLFHDHGIPDGATVLMEMKTGRVLVYATQQSKGPPKDMCADASAPAASVFKIVTASALVEQAGLGPETKQCYHGGMDRIDNNDLVDNPQKDKWCSTMSEAMGRSLNTVFARLAARNLDAAKLGSIAGALGFGFPFQLDAPVETSQISIPEGELGFARTAAGFWNTTLSPIHAAMLASAIGNQGNMIRPILVQSVTDASGTLYKAAPGPQIIRKTVKPETAAAVREMMESTVASGTGYKAFHDAGGKPFLPGIRVAGKTGTLTRASTQQFYTWFVGFAPSDDPQVAIASLVINKPKWQTRANVLARDVLRLYFESKKTPGVTRPF